MKVYLIEQKHDSLHLFRLAVHKEGDEYYNLRPCGNQWFYKIERVLPYVRGKSPKFFISDETPIIKPSEMFLKTTITEYESMDHFYYSFPEYLI